MTINDLRVYVPARDFALSTRFYRALGFETRTGWGGTVDCTLDGHGFRLQDFYVKAWAENTMFVIGVDDIDAWHQRVSDVLAGAAFGGARFKPPETVDGARVLHVWDPSGVLLVFVG